ncbi:MAG: T9SS type A sorting domain-containing protein, partial [Thaumarchaeota archaeon]|nr:T9SS type A sorting domain-containing protein [Nitrososphaerota archaeon]
TKNGKLVIYNLIGKIIKTYNLQKKYNTIEINSKELIPGIYLYSLRVDEVNIETKKLLIIR